jgi:hypothetical protein
VERAALQPRDLKFEVRGIGDSKPVSGYTYLADEIRIGKVVFEHYPIEAFRWAKDSDVDGLIGADVFERFIVAIDFLRDEIALTPRSAKPASNDGFEDSTGIPEGFYRVFRFGNHLAVPTFVTGRNVPSGDKHVRLFLLDSGATTNILDPAVAGVTKGLYNDSDMVMRGVQGKVDKLARADNVTLLFAGFRQANPDLVSMSLDNLSEATGVGFSGILGMPVLRHLKLRIDYENGAIKMDYQGPNLDVRANP